MFWTIREIEYGTGQIEYRRIINTAIVKHSSYQPIATYYFIYAQLRLL